MDGSLQCVHVLRSVEKVWAFHGEPSMVTQYACLVSAFPSFLNRISYYIIHIGLSDPTFDKTNMYETKDSLSWLSLDA